MNLFLIILCLVITRIVTLLYRVTIFELRVFGLFLIRLRVMSLTTLSGSVLRIHQSGTE